MRRTCRPGVTHTSARRHIRTSDAPRPRAHPLTHAIATTTASARQDTSPRRQQHPTFGSANRSAPRQTSMIQTANNTKAPVTLASLGAPKWAGPSVHLSAPALSQGGYLSNSGRLAKCCKQARITRVPTRSCWRGFRTRPRVGTTLSGYVLAGRVPLPEVCGPGRVEAEQRPLGVHGLRASDLGDGSGTIFQLHPHAADAVVRSSVGDDQSEARRFCAGHPAIARAGLLPNGVGDAAPLSDGDGASRPRAAGGARRGRRGISGPGSRVGSSAGRPTPRRSSRSLSRSRTPGFRADSTATRRRCLEGQLDPVHRKRSPSRERPSTPTDGRPIGRWATAATSTSGRSCAPSTIALTW